MNPYLKIALLLLPIHLNCGLTDEQLIIIGYNYCKTHNLITVKP